MQRIYLDESGYSGEDLLNDDQRVFVIATHVLSEDFCVGLKAKHFAKVQALELKHSKLCKRPASQKMVLAALGELLHGHRAVLKSSVLHKEFALLLKIVDLVVETSMNKRGFNLYERGGHIAMSNVMYMCFSLDTVWRGGLLQRFQRMMRERTRETCEDFAGYLKRPHGLRLIDEFRIMILGAFLDVGPSGVFACGDNALDLSFSTAHHLVANWRMELGSSGVELIHDQSSNMAKQKALWDEVVSPSARPATVGIGRRTIQYPLCVKHTAFAPSQNSAGLQIADVLAGAQAYLWSSTISKSPDGYAERLAELFTVELPETSIWPSTDVQPWPETPAGVEHPLDYTAEILAMLRGRRR
jgi:hypothetical protein